MLETIVISLVFGEVEGNGGPCLTPKIIENIMMMPIIFVRRWAVMRAPAQPLKSLETL